MHKSVNKLIDIENKVNVAQTGNNKNYNANLWCGHSYCTMTLNQ